MSVKYDFSDGDYYCFTIDLDWASECAIEKTVSFFMARGIVPTVFVTHDSEIVKEYCKKDDIGIHPNFIQPSSHGNNIDEIIDYCLKLVPDTCFFRCHRWFSSNDIYDRLCEKGFKYESNICTNMDVVSPFEQRSGMISFPTFFEDGAYVFHGYDLNFNSVKDKFKRNGLKIINIHPMHFALNTPYFQYTRDIKDSVSRREWNTMDEDILKKLENKNRGLRDFISELTDFSIKNADKIVTLKEAYLLAMDV